MSGGRESELRILRPTELEPRRFDEPERKCQNPQYVDETPGDPIDKQLLEAANFEGQSQDHRTVTWAHDGALFNTNMNATRPNTIRVNPEECPFNSSCGK